MSLHLLKENCTYTSCYCEENVWHLCKSVQDTTPELISECYAVFISNDLKAIPLWCQVAGNNEHGFVHWDYHVIFIFDGKSSCLVYDLDTTLSFPCPFEEYQVKSLRIDKVINPDFRRVVPAQEYLTKFASDRRHMMKDGQWIKPPPNYEPIQTRESTHNLEAFIDMTNGEGPGKLNGLDATPRMIKCKCKCATPVSRKHLVRMQTKMTEHVRCKKCRATLISQENNKCITNCHGLELNIPDESPCSQDKSLVYIKEELMPTWLETLVQNGSWTKGKINCPSCDARIGSFDFLTGQKCQCEQYLLPAVHLVLSKVDILKQVN